MVRYQLYLVYGILLFFSTWGAPTCNPLSQTKDEVVLVEIHQDLQSSSEGTVAVDQSKTIVSTTATVSTSSTSTANPAPPSTSTRAPSSSSSSTPTFQRNTPRKVEASATPLSDVEADSSTFHLLDEFMDYGGQNLTSSESGYKLGYTVSEGNLKKFRYEERTPEGAIVGEFGFHKNDGVIRGVRYSAEPGVHPKVLYEALVKFFTL